MLLHLTINGKNRTSPRPKTNRLYLFIYTRLTAFSSRKIFLTICLGLYLFWDDYAAWSVWSDHIRPKSLRILHLGCQLTFLALQVFYQGLRLRTIICLNRRVAVNPQRRFDSRPLRFFQLAPNLLLEAITTVHNYLLFLLITWRS